MHILDEKKYITLFTAIGATLLHTPPYFLRYIDQFFQKRFAIDLIEHIAILLLTDQNPSRLHQAQMSGDDRPVLGHVFRDGSDIGPAVEHEELQYLNSNRFAKGFKEF
jgi:hypothetical protein